MPDRRGQIKARVSIDDRPDIVNGRCRVGDWEADTVIGKRGGEVLVTLVERKSRQSVVAKASKRTAKAVSDEIIKKLSPIKHLVKTITYDNGKEFALHQDIVSGLFRPPIPFLGAWVKRECKRPVKAILSKRV